MINLYTDQTVLGGGGLETESKIWRPLRQLTDVDTTVDTITNLQNKVRSLKTTTEALAPDSSASASTVINPFQVTGVSATESPYKTASNQLVSVVAVSFTPNVHDTQFAGVQIWFTGYNGSSVPQLMAEGNSSPVQFLCETTHETVTVTVVAFHADGSRTAFSGAPTTTVSLDGVVSAPPAPSIAQALTAIPSGVQFAFNQVMLGGGVQDVIDSYRVYRGTTSTFGSSTVIDTVKHNPAAAAAIVRQYLVDGGVTYYFWVTAVSVSGLESVETSVGNTTTFPGSVAANYSSYTFTSPSIITQSGATTTITLTASTAQFPGGTLSYNSGSVNPGVYGTFYIYADDPNYVGGAVTYVATTSNPTITANSGRIYFGKITTSGGGGGTGDGGGGGPCFTLDTLLWDGRAIGLIKPGDFVTVERADGKRVKRKVGEVIDHNYSGPVYDCDCGDVTPDHEFRHRGGWAKAADIFENPTHFEGTVRNLHIDTEDEEERNYVLLSGRCAHNLRK